MPNIVQFKTAKNRIDENLADVLMRLAERARAGEITRMVCVCVGEDQTFFNVTHAAGDLALLGALSITVDHIKSDFWRRE